MKDTFHQKPYKYKKLNPQEHSCAVCKNRPLDFCNAPNSKRLNDNPQWNYKIGVNHEDIWEATKKDAAKGGSEHVNSLKDFRKCEVFSWGKSAPFYKNDFKCFDEDISENDA